jgi:hypothetical protein
LRQLPPRKQRRAELHVVKTKRVVLERCQLTLLFNHAREKSRVRLAQLAQQDEYANVLQQPGSERLVA